MEVATHTVPANLRSQDVVGLWQVGNIVVSVVADGAGGMSGGAAAASLVVEAVGACATGAESLLLAPVTWRRVLKRVSDELEQKSVGLTTAVVVATDGSNVVGASVGDSGAFWFGPRATRELTWAQYRKPLIGDGGCEPTTFTGELVAGDAVLLASDGLLKYGALPRIAQMIHAASSLESCCARLTDLVRMPNGRLQDDVGLALMRVR